MKTGQIRSIVFTALFAALFIVMSSISVPLAGITPVPITLQTLAVMLAGAFLGPRLGFLSIFLVVALTVCGLPLLHGNGGLALIKGATGGFILMFPIAAFLVGLFVKLILQSGLMKRSKIAGFLALFLAFELFCSFFVYIGGVPWLANVLNKDWQEAMKLACYPFLIGDTIKAAFAAGVTSALYAFTPLFRSMRRTGALSSEG